MLIKKLITKIIFFTIIFVIFISVSIAAFLFTFNKVWNAISTPVISAPKLVGLSIKDAVKVTGDLNLILKIKSEVQDKNYPEGYIISQNPPPGTKIREENPVEVVIATKSLTKTVPNLLGFNIYDAEEKLSEVGINLLRKAYVYDSVVEKDVVISQFPPPGTLLGKEPGVSLLISKGKKPFFMPSFYGLDIEEAEYISGLLGLKVKDIKDYDIEEIPDGEVVYQSIEPGEEIKKGNEISFGIVSNGKFRTGKYEAEIIFNFSVPDERPEFKVKIVKRDETGDKVLINKTLKGGSSIKGKTVVKGISKLYISLDGILYEIRRVN